MSAYQRKFHVALSPVNLCDGTIAEAIRSRALHYGDPPRHDGDRQACAAGASMNSEPRRVIEYWHRHDRPFVEGCRITNMAVSSGRIVRNRHSARLGQSAVTMREESVYIQ
jgi:hypothetical protein